MCSFFSLPSLPLPSPPFNALHTLYPFFLSRLHRQPIFTLLVRYRAQGSPRQPGDSPLQVLLLMVVVVVVVVVK